MTDWTSQYKQMIANGPQSLGGYLVFGGLWPLSCLYRLVMAGRAFAYRSGVKSVYHASVPVISVGNLSAGGTGKTPMADYLVKALKQRGARPAIVSRGYGGAYRDPWAQVANSEGRLLMAPAQCGDEPYLLAQRNPGVPVYVARERGLGVRAAEANGVDVIVLDDGYQHLAVHRDLNILLLDAGKPFGNGQLLPAGNLREPISAVHRSDLIVMTRAQQVEDGIPGLPDVPVMRCRYRLHDVAVGLDGSERPLASMVGQQCLAFAGIARPDEFFKSLRQNGLDLVTEIALADHQDYTPETLKTLQKACHNHNLLLTTEKDAVKLKAADLPLPCFRVGLELVFDNSEPLDKLIDQTLELKP